MEDISKHFGTLGVNSFLAIHLLAFPLFKAGF